MNLDDLTIAQAREIADLFSQETRAKLQAPPATDTRPVVVCTDKRGVFFGHTTDTTGDTITLMRPQMCVFWDKSIRGVLGLAEVGPNDKCKVSGAPPAIELRGITAVIECSAEAVKAWEARPWKA